MSKFEALEGVEDVHDLHIWSISSNSVSLTCHIRVSSVPTPLPQLYVTPNCASYCQKQHPC